MEKNMIEYKELLVEKQNLERIIWAIGNFAHIYQCNDKTQNIQFIESIYDLLQKLCLNQDDDISVYYYDREDNVFILREEFSPDCSSIKAKKLDKIIFNSDKEINKMAIEDIFTEQFPDKHIEVIAREISNNGFFIFLTEQSNAIPEIILNAMRKIIAAFSLEKVSYGLVKIAREILNKAGEVRAEQVIILCIHIDLSHIEAMARLNGTRDKVKHAIIRIINCPDFQQGKIMHEELQGDIILCLDADPASLEKYITYILQMCNQFVNLNNTFPGLQITPAMDFCVVSGELVNKEKIQSVLSSLNRVQNMAEQYAYYKAPVLISKAVNNFITRNIHNQAAFYIRKLVLKSRVDNSRSEIKELYQLVVDETFNKDFLANYNRAFALRKDNPEESERILRDLLDNSKKRDIPAQELYRECVSETLGSFY